MGSIKLTNVSKRIKIYQIGIKRAQEYQKRLKRIAKWVQKEPKMGKKSKKMKNCHEKCPIGLQK